MRVVGLCVDDGGCAHLRAGRLYSCRTSDDADQAWLIHVIDDSGTERLYSMGWFMLAV